MYENQFKVEAEVEDVVYVEPTTEGVVDHDKRHIAITFAYEMNGRSAKVIHRRYFSDKALPWTEKDLQTIGWDPIKNAWAIDELCEFKPIVGNRVNLVLEEEEYNGKRRINVKFVNGIGPKAASTDAARSFAAQLRKKVGLSAPASTSRPAAKPQPKPAPQPKRAEQQDIDAEGIPF